MDLLASSRAETSCVLAKVFYENVEADKRAAKKPLTFITSHKEENPVPAIGRLHVLAEQLVLQDALKVGYGVVAERLDLYGDVTNACRECRDVDFLIVIDNVLANDGVEPSSSFAQTGGRP